MVQIYNFQPSQPIVKKPTSNFPGLDREQEVQLVNFVKSKNPEASWWELFAEVRKAYTDIYNNEWVPQWIVNKSNKPQQPIKNTPPDNQWGLRRGSSRFKVGGKIDKFFDDLNVVGKWFEKLDDAAQKIPTVSEAQTKQFLDKNLWGFGSDFAKLPTMAANAPWSLVKTATATARGITNPVDTLVWLGKLIFSKEWRKAIVDRYGTVEGFEKALTEDPVGVASDALTVVQWGASLTSKWANLLGFTNVADTAWDISRTAWWAADLWLSTAIPKWLDLAIENAPWWDVGKNIVKWAVAWTRPVQAVSEGLESWLKKLVDSGILPWAEETLQNLNRITKWQQEKFAQQQGKNVWEWLNERGIVEWPRGTVEVLQKHFLDNKAQVDNALDTLSMDWLFQKEGSKLKNKRTQLMIDDVVRHAEKTENPALGRMQELKKTHDEWGFFLNESNEVKRYFERNNKMSYGKDITAGEKTQRATNVDNWVRESQIAKAEELGFKNLRELNKETQWAKFIMDKLAKNTNWKLGNNYMSLTDWIVAAWATVDPSMLGALVAKKTLNTNRFRKNYTKIVNKINWHESVSAKVVDLVELQNVKTPKQLSLFLKE